MPRGQLTLVALLLATFTIELIAGFVVINNGDDRSGLDTSSNLLVASLLIGVARAWELVGDRDTGRCPRSPRWPVTSARRAAMG